MDNEDYLNRLRALTNQQNVPLRIKPAEQPRIPQQYAPTYNAPTIPFTPQPAKPKPQAPFPQRAQSFITSAGSQLGGGLLRGVVFRAAPTAARFSPVGLSSYVAGRLGGRDVIGELQKRGEELAKESERLQEQELARLPDQSAVRPGKLFGSTIKGVADVAALVAPSMLASKLLQGTQLVQRGLQAGPGVRLATKAAESVLSGLPASAVDVLQQIGRGEKPSAARSLAVGAAVDLGVPFLGEGIRAIRDSRVLTRLAETDSAQRVFNYLRRTAPEVEEQAARTAAEDIAKTTNPEEVATIVDDLIEQTPTRPTVPEPTPVPTPTPTSAVQAVTENLARQTDVNQIRQTVQELFPALDENGQLQFSQRIAAANTPEAVEAVLDQAEEASRAITQAIEEVTPPAVAPTERAIAQSIEQPLTAPTRVSEAPTAPQPATVAPRVAEPTAVQGAVDINQLPDTRKPVTINNQTKSFGEFLIENKNKAESKNYKSSDLIGQEYNPGLNQSVLTIEDLRTNKSIDGLEIIGDVFKASDKADEQLVIYIVDHTKGTWERKLAKEAEGLRKLAELDTMVKQPTAPAPATTAPTTTQPAGVAEAAPATTVPDTGKVFYHGTNNQTIKSLEDLKPGKEASKSSLNRVYVTENPEIAKNFGKNVIEQRLYGKHLNANEIGIRISPDPSVDKVVAPEFSDYLTSPLLSSRDRNVFENAFVKSIPTNTIIEDTPAIHRYLESKGYTTITIPRVISDVNGPRTETIIISNKAFQPEIPTTIPVSETPTVPGTTVPGAAGAGGTPPTPPLGGQPKVSEVLYGTDTPSEEQGLDFIRRFSPNRLIREYVTRPAQDFVNRMFAKAQVSGVAPLRGLGRLGTGISRELGATPELLAARKKFLQGTGEFGKIVREDIVALGKGLSDTVQQRVWATLDPELAAAKGIKVSIADLQPEELAYRDELVKIRDAITQENLDRGLINEEQARANWFKRGYEIFDFEPEAKTAYQDTKRGLLKQFKGRKDISEELVEAAIEDPSYLLAKKAADSHAVWGMVDYGNWLAANDLVSDVARPGYRQLPTSKIYGEASGKFVPTNIAEDFTGFQFNNAITNAFNDVITAYDNLGVRKAKKAILTVLNPTVRLGNQLSNRVIFAQLGGINPFTFNKNFIRVKKLSASRDPLYLEAVKRGLTGLDMTQKEFTSKVAEYTGQPNLAQKAWEWAKGSYSQADDTARIAAFVTNVERGYSLDEAARLSQRAFQDYKSVGFLYDIAAKTPIVGNAFVRFAGDSARILTNALVDQPLTLAGSLTGLWALGEYMSRMSGETPDEKKTREERFGAPKVPFVNIPLEIQTPWGAVNAARFLPYYNLNEIQGNLTKFLPFAGNPLESKNWNDPLLGQALQILVDKDFRGKSIAEPENVGQFRTPTPSDVALENRVRFALTQNVPLGREIDALYSAAKGQEDVYGGERSLGQAIGRLFGVKVEKFGPEQVNKLKENEAFFADKKFIDDQLATMPKDLQEKYKKLTGYYKLRDQVENTFAKGKMRFKKEPVFAFSEDKYKELSSSPELYDLLMQQKIRDNQRDGKPIPPEFDMRLSNEFRRQLIENKSLRPGEDLEADERMFTNPEWDTYQAIKKEYTAKAKEFYPQTSGEFNDELVKHQNADFPEKGGAYKEYSDAYALFAKGQGPKPTFTDAVAVDKEKYNQAKLDWVNKERKARGLAPISPEVWNNVTFGFTSDEEKVYNELRYGRGLGGFGFSSTSPDYKAAMAALKRAGITVKPLEIISAAPRRVRLQRVRVPTTRRTARIRLR